LKFYKELPYSEALAGDTLGPFRIVPVVEQDGERTRLDVTGCSMQLLLASEDRPADAVLTLDCEIVDGAFEVTVLSSATAGLRGGYRMHFALRKGEKVHRKLMGRLYFHPVPLGGAV